MKKILFILLLVFIISCIASDKVEIENNSDIVITDIKSISYYGTGRRHLIITIIKDKQTEKEYIIFDNFNDIEVMER